MEMGTEENYENFLESIRWHRSGADDSEWKVQSLLSHEVRQTARYGDYCEDALDDPGFVEDEAQITITDNGTFDRTLQKA